MKNRGKIFICALLLSFFSFSFAFLLSAYTQIEKARETKIKSEKQIEGKAKEQS